jgi:hypothetical protein
VLTSAWIGPRKPDASADSASMLPSDSSPSSTSLAPDSTIANGPANATTPTTLPKLAASLPLASAPFITST